MKTSQSAGQRRNEKDLLRIDCPVLQKNCRMFVERYVPTDPFVKNQQELDEIKFGLAAKPPSLDLYGNKIPELRKQFSLDDSDLNLLIDNLERMALGYIAEFQTIIRRKSISEMIAQITDFLQGLETSLKFVERDTQVYKALFGSFTGDNKQSAIYAESFQSLLDANETLKSLPDFIRDSETAKAMKLGIRAPIGNPALQRWTTGFYLIWTEQLDRTIENSNDGLNGRIHLLSFMEACIQPIHPALESETLNNMLRKVQQSAAKLS